MDLAGPFQVTESAPVAPPVAVNCAGSKFFLWNEDTQTLVEEVTSGDVFCAETFEFSIQAFPGCAAAESAVISMVGPSDDVTRNKTERNQPYFVFGDDIAVNFTYNLANPGLYEGNINGNVLVAGAYTIGATFYDSSNNQTPEHFLTSITASFSVVTCIAPVAPPAAAPVKAPVAAPVKAPVKAPVAAPV